MDSKYCYPGTDVLINYLGIREREKLHAIERDITNARSAELAVKPIKGGYDLKHLQKIHKKLLGDIYPFAGEIRDVRIAKGNMFCYPEFIYPMAEDIFTKLANEQHLKGLETGPFVERLSFYMAEVNALHPFREGNGRTQRVFFTQLAQDAGYKLHFEQMDKEQLLQADIAGMSGDYSKLQSLILKHIEPLQKQSIRARLEELNKAEKKINPYIYKEKEIER